MGVISTGAIFKTLTFDGRSSSEFNVYITGEGVFNAPERAVEMISIPGRNGAFALDYGRFENIEVTYNCGIAGDDDADFASAVSAFRNWLCSRNGYVRLSDDYNTGEYRMAVYKSGLEVTAENLKAGEFPVVFECKPQRFLTSGETAVAVTSGDDITNPTLFDSSPLLEIDGYGTLNIGDVSITIDNTLVGDVIVLDYIARYGTGCAVHFNDVPMRTGDTITVNNIQHSYTIYANNSTFTSQTITDVTGSPTYMPNVTSSGNDTAVVTAQLDSDPTTYIYGTPASKIIGYHVNVTNSNGDSMTIPVTLTLKYDGEKAIMMYMQMFIPSTTAFNVQATMFSLGTGINPAIVAHSTASTYGNPTYIDTDVGEAYAYLDGVINSLNRYIQLPAELPTLAPGNTTITYDNTITQFKVVPRWWKI